MENNKIEVIAIILNAILSSELEKLRDITNMSNLTQYLKDLHYYDLIECDVFGKDRSGFIITNKGISFLKIHSELHSELNEHSSQMRNKSGKRTKYCTLFLRNAPYSLNPIGLVYKLLYLFRTILQKTQN